MMPLVYPKWSHTIDFRHSLVKIKDRFLVPLCHSESSVCSSLRVSDKHRILSWCTARVTFCFAQAATFPFRATETFGVEELLRLINRDVLKGG